MKAIVLTGYGSPEALELRDVQAREPGPEEVLIRVHAASVNDWDWCLCRGKPFYVRLLCGLTRPKVPIPGVDVAGVVVRAGSEVQRWKPGDRVFGDLSAGKFGAFAEFACARHDALAEAPAALSFQEAAALPHAATLALQSLRDVAQLQPGERLLVNGAGGGVGTLAVQLARHVGVTHVTGVDHEDKHERMRAIGYTRVVDYRTCDFTRMGERYDVVLDVRTDRPVRSYVRALRPGGRYVTVGGHTGKLFRVAVLGPLVGRFVGRRLGVLSLEPNRGLGHIRALCDEGHLRPVVDRVFPLDEVPQAIRRFGEGLHTGKIVVGIGDA